MPTAKLPHALRQSSDDLEQAFYDAMEVGSVDAMMSLWSTEDDIACIHPNSPRIEGFDAIRAIFAQLFADGGLVIHPILLHKFEQPDLVVHHVLEQVTLNSERGEELINIAATNVYQKTPQGWRMVFHHASPAAEEMSAAMLDVPHVLH
jgi:ketosteroid isomerase-like protein